MRETQSRGKPVWLRSAPAIFLLFWAAGFPIAKIGIQYAEPLTFLAIRYACVVLLLFPALLWMRPALPANAAAWGHLAVVGFLIQGLYFSLGWLAMAYGVSAGAAALIVSLQPILVGLLAPSLAGEPVGRWRWLGLLLGLSGAALVIVERSAVEAVSVTATLTAFLSLFAMTGGTLYEKRFGVVQHPVTANLVQGAVGLAVTLVAASIFETMHVSWTEEFVGALAYMVIANSLIAVSLLLAMIRHGEVSRVSALFFLVPPLAALIAWAAIGETMPPLAWVGIAAAAAGVAIAKRF